MKIVIINHSKCVVDADASKMAAAIEQQINECFLQYWPVVDTPISVQVAHTNAEASLAVYITNNGDVKNGEAGYNQYPYAYVFADVILHNDGDVLSAPRQGMATVSAAVSHEILEALVDPQINTWCQGVDGWLWAKEVADPVESWSYPCGADDVAVSNFVLPSFFDPDGKKPFDSMKKIDKPFSIDPHGFALKMRGEVTEMKSGNDYAQFRRAAKDIPQTRTARRCSLTKEARRLRLAQGQ